MYVIVHVTVHMLKMNSIYCWMNWIVHTYMYSESKPSWFNGIDIKGKDTPIEIFLYVYQF